MTTQASLALMAAQELQLVAAGGALSADDQILILDRLTKLRAWLIEEDLCYWDADSIPDAASIPVAKLLAHECKDVFGVPYNKFAEGMAQLRRHIAKRANGEPGRADFF
jgi:hypothetical protein